MFAVCEVKLAVSRVDLISSALASFVTHAERVVRVRTLVYTTRL